VDPPPLRFCAAAVVLPVPEAVVLADVLVVVAPFLVVVAEEMTFPPELVVDVGD
jgi:hypothetical protein